MGIAKAKKGEPPKALAKKSARPIAKAAPEKRTRRSREDILARIFEAAGEEFKASGYAGATTAAIARRADVTEAQLFRYFSSKEELFRETIFKPIDQHFSDFNKSHGLTAANSGELYLLYVSELNRFISENADALVSLLVAQAYEKGAAQGVGQSENLKTYFDHGAAMLRTTREGAPAHDPRLIVRIAFATVLSCVIFRRWIFPPDLASNASLMPAINDFILGAVDANYRSKGGKK